MINAEQIKDLRARIAVLQKSLHIEDKRAEVAQKQEKTLAPDFWNDAKAAEKYLKELAAVKFWVTACDALVSAADDLDVLYDFAKEAVSPDEEEGKQCEEEKELEQLATDEDALISIIDHQPVEVNWVVFFEIHRFISAINEV